MTTCGSARVLVSPSSSSCLEAIFLRILLIIFPLLVFGSPGAQWILSGAANAPIWNVQQNMWEISYKMKSCNLIYNTGSIRSSPHFVWKYKGLRIDLLSNCEYEVLTQFFTVWNTVHKSNKSIYTLSFNL